MSYQKQKANLIRTTSQQDGSDSAHQPGIAQKKKRIQKEFEKDEDSNEALYTNLSKKKKQVAKEIKRIREQNRRANHKQYVATLEEQIKQKEVQIQNLSTRIKELQMQLDAKVCHKCGNDLTEVGINGTPISVPEPNFIEIEQRMGEVSQSLPQINMQQIEEESMDYDDQFRRVDDDCSLRICFGNKNLLFFLVTMCCLTIGSIADNPEMFLQPIHPFMLKSQLYYLPTFNKLNSLLMKPKKQPGWNAYDLQQFSQLPPPDQNISRVSDLFKFQINLSKFWPQNLQFMSNIKDPAQMLFGMGVQQILGRLLEGRNYYI